METVSQASKYAGLYRHVGVLPSNILSSVHQMADIVKHQEGRKNTLLTGKSSEGDVTRASAYVEASARTFASALIGLNAVLDSVTRSFGNDLNSLNSFSRNLADLHSRLFTVINKHSSETGVFDISTPQVANLIQAKGGKSLAAGLQAMLRMIPGNDAGQVLNEKQLLTALVPFVMPMTRQRDYWHIAAQHDNKINPNVNYRQLIGNYKQLYPALFQGEHLPLDPRGMTPATHQQVFAAQKDYGNQKLSQKDWDIIRR